MKHQLNSLRTIHTCEATFHATVGIGDYANLTTLSGHTLTDVVLGSGSKSGYSFEVHPTQPSVRPALFYSTATPLSTTGPAKSGSRRFGMTEDGIMHGDAVLLVPYPDHDEVRAAPALGN